MVGRASSTRSNWPGRSCRRRGQDAVVGPIRVHHAGVSSAAGQFGSWAESGGGCDGILRGQPGGGCIAGRVRFLSWGRSGRGREFQCRDGGRCRVSKRLVDPPVGRSGLVQKEGADADGEQDRGRGRESTPQRKRTGGEATRQGGGEREREARHRCGQEQLGEVGWGGRRAGIA